MNGNPMQMLMQMFSMGNNPQQMVQRIVNQNPQVQAVFNQMKSSGMTSEQFARQYAKQNNINIDEVINTLRGMGMKF